MEYNSIWLIWVCLKTEDTSSNPRWLLRNEEHDDTQMRNKIFLRQELGTAFAACEDDIEDDERQELSPLGKNNMDSFGRLQIHLGSVQHLCWLMILWDFIIQ